MALEHNIYQLTTIDSIVSSVDLTVDSAIGSAVYLTIYSSVCLSVWSYVISDINLSVGLVNSDVYLAIKSDISSIIIKDEK